MTLTDQEMRILKYMKFENKCLLSKIKGSYQMLKLRFQFNLSIQLTNLIKFLNLKRISHFTLSFILMSRNVQWNEWLIRTRLSKRTLIWKSRAMMRSKTLSKMSMRIKWNSSLRRLILMKRLIWKNKILLREILTKWVLKQRWKL